jgi:hypothetical protein
MTEDWLTVLREKVAQKTQAQVARRLGVSSAMISQVISGKYPADLEKLAERVRGEFMGKKVYCPVYGDISRRNCIDHQALPFLVSDPDRVACWKACRSGCENSFLENEYGDW